MKAFSALMAGSVLALCSCGSKQPADPKPAQAQEQKQETAQQPQQEEKKQHELTIAEVQPYFERAEKINAIDTAFYEVLDAKGNKIGTVLLSSPYSDDVKGFNGPTPLLIAMDADGYIKDVVLLENEETPKFAKIVADGGLYQAWDGLTSEEALDKEVDAVSGATYTSNGVKNSLKARLQAYQKQLKK